MVLVNLFHLYTRWVLIYTRQCWISMPPSTVSSDSDHGKKLVRNVTLYVDGTVYVHPEDEKLEHRTLFFDIWGPKKELSKELLLHVPSHEVLYYVCPEHPDIALTRQQERICVTYLSQVLTFLALCQENTKEELVGKAPRKSIKEELAKQKVCTIEIFR